jgi:hypothetical protein
MRFCGQGGFLSFHPDKRTSLQPKVHAVLPTMGSKSRRLGRQQGVRSIPNMDAPFESESSSARGAYPQNVWACQGYHMQGALMNGHIKARSHPLSLRSERRGGQLSQEIDGFCSTPLRLAGCGVSTVVVVGHASTRGGNMSRDWLRTTLCKTSSGDTEGSNRRFRC